MRIRLREVRERLFVTQAELAEATGLTESTISRIENGLQVPRISTVKRIAKALGVAPDEIMERDEDLDMGKAAA